MKKIISFSLYGNDPKYTTGAIRNAELAKSIYPGWTPRFYIGRSVPFRITEILLQHEAEIVEKYNEPEDSRATFWRFEVFSDNNAEFAIIRDTDSRLNLREAEAVNEWLKSGNTFHIMRDHPYHSMPIMAGMWGARCIKLAGICNMIKDFQTDFIGYGLDQLFLSQVIYPLTRGDVMSHDSFYNFEKHLSFPSSRKQLQYVGESFDEYDNRSPLFNEIPKRRKISIRKYYHWLKLRYLNIGLRQFWQRNR
jgi:protein O-GlcNAc transferase